MLVGHDLDLDVAGALAELLDVDLGVAETGLGLGACGGEGVGQGGRGMDHFHPPAAAAGGRLDDDRVADLGRERFLASSAV